MGRRREGQGDGKREGRVGGWEEGGRDIGMGRRRAGQGDGKKEGREGYERNEGGAG